MFGDAKQSHGHPNYMVNYIHFLFYTVSMNSTVEKKFAWLKNWKLSISCLPLGNS